MKEKGLAVILAFFTGGIGGHQYYLGDTKKGIFYTVFCFTFIPSFFALYDAVILLSMSDNEFNLKYNQAFLKPSNTRNGINEFDGLEKLHVLKEKGALTEEEYENEKQKLLAS